MSHHDHDHDGGMAHDGCRGEFMYPDMQGTESNIYMTYCIYSVMCNVGEASANGHT